MFAAVFAISLTCLKFAPALQNIGHQSAPNSSKQIDLPAGISRQSVRSGASDVRLDVYNSGRPGAPVVILLHGSAGIEDPERRERYQRFATDLMVDGFVAINVYYFDSPQMLWENTIRRTIDFAQSIRNADSEKIGLVGYSLGGILAISVAAKDRRVKALAINAGHLPDRFGKKQAEKMPPVIFLSGDQDEALASLTRLRDWYVEMGKHFEYRISAGQGHVAASWEAFWEEWAYLRVFLYRQLMAG